MAVRTDRAPLVSIIMSMRNAAATVRDAVHSLQLQTLGDWELILLDDGSSDESAKIVKSIEDPRISLLVDGRRKGLAARLNQAVELARGRFIARMDADDICFPTRLERQVAYLEGHPNTALVASSAVVFNDRDLIGILPVGLHHDDIVRRPFHGFPLPHPTWCGRTEWFRANPYDGSLGKTQDQDLLLRSFVGSTFGGMPEVLVGYRQQRLEIKKLLRGRLVFIRSLWRHGRRFGSLPAVLDGIASHAVKAAADIVTLGLGLNRWQQRRRLAAVPPEVRQAWPQLCARLRSSEKT